MKRLAAGLMVVRSARSICRNSRRPVDPGTVFLMSEMALVPLSEDRPAT